MSKSPSSVALYPPARTRGAVHVVPELGGLQDVAGHGDVGCLLVARAVVYSKLFQQL